MIITNVGGGGNSIKEISTDQEMIEVWVSNNIGKTYKFIGATTSKYTNGDFYIVAGD